MNYKELVDKLDSNKVKGLLLELGADEVQETNSFLLTNTICHNARDGSFKLYYYKNTHLFYCYTECGPMSIFTFLKHYYETRNIDYDWYSDIYEVARNCSASGLIRENFGVEPHQFLKDKYAPIIRTQSLPTYPKGILDVFQKCYPAQWLEEGISKSAMDKYNILFSSSQNKIIIPHYDVNGNLVGIRGRALNEWEVENIGKYMPVQIEQKWYSHRLSLNLYGLNHTKANIQKYGIAFIMEGEKSILKLEDFDTPNCGAAICGSNFNKYQLNLLMRECNPKEICLCLDNEEKPHHEDYFNKLYGICKKYNKYATFSFIYDDSGLTRKKDSPVDQGEAVFLKLLAKRRIIK